MLVELGDDVEAACAHLTYGHALVEQQVEQIDDLGRGRGRGRGRGKGKGRGRGRGRGRARAGVRGR